MITRIVRNAIWLGGGEAAVKGGLLVATVLVARGSGPSAVGTFSIGFSAALIAVMLLAFGQQEVLIREVARAPGDARGLLAGSDGLQRRVAGWLLPAAVIVLVLVREPNLRLTLLAFLPYAALRTATVTGGAAFKGLDRMDVEARARGIEVAAAVALIAAAALWRWPVWTAGAAFSVGSGLGLWWLRRRVGQLGAAVDPVPWRRLAREGLPFMMLAVAGQLLANLDRFLLALLGVARADIGFWGAAGTVVWAVIAIPQLMSAAMYPTFSRVAATGVPRGRLGVVAGLAAAAAGVVCCGVVRVAGGLLLRLAFGAEFGPAEPLLARLALALPGAFAMMVMGAVFAAWREQRIALAITAATVGVSCALNLVWIPRLGVAAPANVAVAAYTTAAVLMAAALIVLPKRPTEVP
jgi:O-antigen/teichoic acid export membrane protein